MKSYAKPTLEVISMRTSENIADDSMIKTIYQKAAGQASYSVIEHAGAYDPDIDLNGSDIL